MSQFTKDVLSFAGDINVEKMSIISTNGTEYSILNQIAGLQIFEDMFAPFITGTITVKDSLDFVSVLPMIGQELLDIDMHTPTLKDRGGRLKGQFYIYRIKNRQFLGDKSLVYELDFISKEAITDCNVKTSKSYSGKVSELVKQVLTDVRVQFDSVKELVIEETSNSTQYISNYWSPIKNMNFLAESAKNINNSPSYLFFENRDGFNFGSLDTLVSSPTISQTFNYNSFTQNISKTGPSQRNVSMDFQKIENISVTEGINTLNRIQRGFMASTLTTVDITTKKFEFKYYNSLVGHYTTKHLNEFPLVNYKFPIDPSAKSMTEPKAFMNFTSFGDSTNTESIQRRIYELNAKNDFKVNIVVPGRLDYTVGQVVKLDLTRVQPIKKDDSLQSIKDEIYSGKYLITAINHFITREKHECNMELAKDSYIADFSQPRE